MNIRKQQHGSSLIEVLVAVLVTATGVIGAAALQLNSVKFNQTAGHRSTAVFLANDINDRMRANRDGATAGNYDRAVQDDLPKGDSIADTDTQEWVNEIRRRLPSGDGSVVSNGSTYTVTIQWSEARVADSRLQDKDNPNNLESFVFVTEL